jgi:hypothetical protein
MFHYIDRRGHLWQSIDRFLDATGASFSLRLSRPMRLQTGVALPPRYDDLTWAGIDVFSQITCSAEWPRPRWRGSGP